MDASNEGGLGGLDNTMEFHEINQKAPTIPTLQSQFLRDNVYRYYNVNENILMSKFSESEWNAFYESVIEPIALQLSLEFTFKLLTERERGFRKQDHIFFKSFYSMRHCRHDHQSERFCMTEELSQSTNSGGFSTMSRSKMAT